MLQKYHSLLHLAIIAGLGYFEMNHCVVYEILHKEEKTALEDLESSYQAKRTDLMDRYERVKAEQQRVPQFLF